MTALSGILIGCFEAFAASAAENIARGKSYTFSAPPNYKFCTDAVDKTDLKGSFGWHVLKMAAALGPFPFDGIVLTDSPVSFELR